MSNRPAALLKQGILTLQQAGVVSPRADARQLLAAAANVEPAGLATISELDTAVVAAYDQLLARRAAGEPLQYVTGVAWFRKIHVAVGPGVFIPRPETEVVVDFALRQLLAMRPATGSAPVVVDLGTGSGVIAASIAHEYPGEPRIYAVEKSLEALYWTRKNLAETGVTVIEKDFTGPLSTLGELERLAGSVDLVISNPPYIPSSHSDQLPSDVTNFDPAEALFSGVDGLDAMRGLVVTAAQLLKPGGWLVAEHDDTQAQTAVDVVQKTGDFIHVTDHLDLTARPRFVTAVRAQAMGQ